MTKFRMHIACWLTLATHKQSICVILTAFPLQQKLHDHASILRYTYLSSLFRNQELGINRNCTEIYTNSITVITICLCWCFGNICVFWQLRGCFGNMCTCIYCVLYYLYCVFVL
jgi:hypothetical protein